MLSDAKIRAAKPPPSKTLKLSDSGGLQLWLQPTGSKLWNLAYRFEGRQKKLAIGPYPHVGLKAAREKRDEAKALLAAGVDPGQQKREAKANASRQDAANTFEAIAAELREKKRREGKAERTLVKFDWYMSLARDGLGARPVAEVTAPDILAVLRPIEARGRHETAEKLRGAIGQVLRYAIATARASNDPTTALRGALVTPTVTPRAAIIAPVKFGALLRAIDGFEGAPETRIALQLLALTFARPGELRLAEWSEFDLEAALWIVPATRMKMRREHRVPLASQALTLLRELREVWTGRSNLLFPGQRSAERPISENTINAALRRLGFSKDEMTGHGFRASASSMLNESGLWSADAIERQLAHVDNDSVRRAYHRAEYWDARVKMMRWWADRCDELRRMR